MGFLGSMWPFVIFQALIEALIIWEPESNHGREGRVIEFDQLSTCCLNLIFLAIFTTEVTTVPLSVFVINNCMNSRIRNQRPIGGKQRYYIYARISTNNHYIYITSKSGSNTNKHENVKKNRLWEFFVAKPAV